MARGKLANLAPRKELEAAKKLQAAVLEGSTDSEKDQFEEEVVVVDPTQPAFVCVSLLEDQKEELDVFVESTPPEFTPPSPPAALHFHCHQRHQLSFPPSFFCLQPAARL